MRLHVENAQVLRARRPYVLAAALAEFRNRPLVLKGARLKDAVGELPHSAAHRFALLDRNQITVGDNLAFAGGAQDLAVERHLLRIAETPRVALEVVESLAGLKVADDRAFLRISSMRFCSST